MAQYILEKIPPNEGRIQSQSSPNSPNLVSSLHPVLVSPPNLRNPDRFSTLLQPQMSSSRSEGKVYDVNLHRFCRREREGG